MAALSFAIPALACCAPAATKPSDEGRVAGTASVRSTRQGALQLTARVLHGEVRDDKRVRLQLQLKNLGSRAASISYPGGLLFNVVVRDSPDESSGRRLWDYDLELFRKGAAPGVEVTLPGPRPPMGMVLKAGEVVSRHVTIPLVWTRPVWVFVSGPNGLTIPPIPLDSDGARR